MTCTTCNKESGWEVFGNQQCFGCYMGTSKRLPTKTVQAPAPTVNNRGQVALTWEEPLCQQN